LVKFCKDPPKKRNQIFVFQEIKLLRQGKASTWEGGIRSPAIAWWPGTVKAGIKNMEIASHMDLLPTFFELAGVPPPSDRLIDGKSVVPLLTNPAAQTPHDFLFFYREKMLMAVRYRAFKAHFYTRNSYENDP